MTPSPDTTTVPASGTVPVPVSGARKAAIFIMGVGGALGAELLRQLEPD
jgi:hypothetical protein